MSLEVKRNVGYVKYIYYIFVQSFVQEKLKCLTSLIFKEMQINTGKRCFLICIELSN